MSKYLLGKFLVLFVLLFFAPNLGIAQHHEDTTKVHEAHDTAKDEKKFKPGKFIIDHISDSYEWHITTLFEKHVSIYLPVILVSKHSGEFHVFMSSKFHHGHEAYNGFEIAHEGENKGKVVEMVDGKEMRPYDISITKNTLSLFIGVTILLWIFISVARTYTRRRGKAPKGLQNLLEMLILFIRDDVAKESLGEKKYRKFTPYLLTVFFFIFINNLLGLVPIFPGGANLTGNVAVTMVLALFTFLITSFNANANYWKHIVWTPGVPWWLKVPPLPIMPLVEIMGIFVKPFVLMVRLFANITAGHIVGLGFLSLIFIFGEISTGAGFGGAVFTTIFTVFLFFLELLVAFIQAYVFTLLSALYFGMATEEHEHAEHH